MQSPTGVQDRPAEAAVLQRFLTSLEGLHVDAHVVKDAAETTVVLRKIMSKAACESVVVAGIPSKYAGSVKDALTGLKVDLVEDLPRRPQSEAIEVLASADAGVTWAVNGVAMEGALLEVVYDDSFKLASALPIVHVALLEAASVLRDLAQAMPLIGEVVKEAPKDRKPIISFISGPSKTGDIEMRLLYGVHGPHTVHAIILDWH